MRDNEAALLAEYRGDSTNETLFDNTEPILIKLLLNIFEFFSACISCIDSKAHAIARRVLN